ncbi:hypothetical protein C4J81_03125 [Deltaproteobacteria bacterium Smac51]|nr:hypothetical protein C4J81_03125 [Deltaproteobacteria bacterium Smac51]
MDNTSRWYTKKAFQVPAAVVIVLILFSLFVMVINYSFPSFFTISYVADGTPTVKNLSPEEAQELDAAGENPEVAPPAKDGLMFTDTILLIGDDMFSNWLPNDKVWPTIFLDNPQNFQLGQLEMMRYTMRVMRDMLTKRETTDKIDPDCEEAFTLLSNDPYKWLIPSAESRFRGAMDRVRNYRANLDAGKTGFYGRENSLKEMLGQYVSLLGGVNTRLANAPKLKGYRTSVEFVGETGSTRNEQLVDTNVPWYKIDDNFYYAQGVAYVLRQMMVAIKHDFKDVLVRRSAMAQVDSIIEVLDEAQFEPWVVLNGNVGSMMANHSMELHSILENARQKIRSLNDMLAG